MVCIMETGAPAGRATKTAGAHILLWDNIPGGDEMTVAVVGGDRRLTVAGQVLSEHGHRVVYCMAEGAPEGAEICPAMETLPQAEVLLLPVPLARGGTLFCPAAGRPVPLSLAETLLLRSGICFCGGAPDGFVRAARQAGCRLTDLLCDDAFLWENAHLTAEAAVGLALRECDACLRGAPVAVIGYGRIARLLTRLLCAVGARVTVFARKAADRAEALLCGASAAWPTERLAEGALEGTSVVFNTAPAPLLNAAATVSLSPAALVIELASGGLIALPEKDPPRLLPAPGLPGKWFPQSAGRAVAEAVLRLSAT